MKWTDETPKKNGWYWLLTFSESGEPPQIVKVVDGWIWFTGRAATYSVQEYEGKGYWAGPVPVVNGVDHLPVMEMVLPFVHQAFRMAAAKIREGYEDDPGHCPFCFCEAAPNEMCSVHSDYYGAKKALEALRLFLPEPQEEEAAAG